MVNCPRDRSRRPRHRLAGAHTPSRATTSLIAHKTRDLVQPLLITPGRDLNSRFGYYKHDDLIGIPYGSKVGSRNRKGFIHVLRPTPELWTVALPHRTQILYLADIAFITSWLDIRRGSHVIEAGRLSTLHVFSPRAVAHFVSEPPHALASMTRFGRTKSIFKSSSRSAPALASISL